MHAAFNLHTWRSYINAMPFKTVHTKGSFDAENTVTPHVGTSLNYA
jgi:hypothetical protein